MTVSEASANFSLRLFEEWGKGFSPHPRGGLHPSTFHLLLPQKGGVIKVHADPA